MSGRLRVVKSFVSGTEAQISSGRLSADGILNQVQGSRAYTSLLLGGTDGRWQILVNDADFDRAHAILQAPVLVSVSADETAPNPKLILKKAIMLACFGIFLAPLIFQIFSIQQAVRYWKTENDFSTKIFWVFVLGLLYLAGFISAWLMISPWILSR
jgi:hypothetical protein